MIVSPAALRKRLIDQASEPYRAAGRFAYHFARGKLGRDPVFVGMLERGIFPDAARILDLGCGQGLLAAWLLAARQLYDAGDWSAQWPAPPRVADLRGIDLLTIDVQRARRACGGWARFEAGDMRQMDLGQADVVVIMDAAHYVDGPSQDELLRRVRAALPPNGLFLTRVGDAGGGLRFQLSNWIDRAVALFHGLGWRRLYPRRLPDWIQALEALGFRVETVPMNGLLPFANVMLIARLGEGAGVGNQVSAIADGHRPAHDAGAPFP
ncbi:trans-aconitate 2-methyltransferase [uncultured Thiodictyon sp.]|jgi:SAM-dependent methyltransferase|uniref:class I SAM-dependent methyltransferase n=1 Tax=uncultured Thiodictyon sp. TaxID=1846217 RepID=UPI0025E8C9C4|nr:class I SAM-dependent methyltransferase [uncultured Thiodictyon sp.]